jgi:hypothetical protein
MADPERRWSEIERTISERFARIERELTGSIPALTEFFKSMPPVSGAELLRRSTPMPVMQAADGQAVQPNRVSVSPPTSIWQR